jgi:transposase
MTIIRIGLDTSKHVFQIHGVDENEKPVLRRQLRRSEMAKFFTKLPPTRIGLEACGAAHHWARLLRGVGHEVLLMPPQYIKPYVKRSKNDAIDAEAICEAMSRPTMRFVAVKSADTSGSDDAQGPRSVGQAAHDADQRDPRPRGGVRRHRRERAKAAHRAAAAPGQ